MPKTIKELLQENKASLFMQGQNIANIESKINADENLLYANVFNLAKYALTEKVNTNLLHLKNRTSVVFVITNKRIVYSGVSLLGDLDLNLIRIRERLPQQYVIKTDIDQTAIDCKTKDQEIIDDILNDAISKLKENQQQPTTLSAADEIMKFKQLMDAGVISQEEFELKKKQLLNL